MQHHILEDDQMVTGLFLERLLQSVEVAFPLLFGDGPGREQGLLLLQVALQIGHLHPGHQEPVVGKEQPKNDNQDNTDYLQVAGGDRCPAFFVRYFSAVPDIPLLPVFRGYEGIGFRKLFGAIA